VLVRTWVLWIRVAIWRTVITRCCFAASATNIAITDGGGIGAWPAVLQAVPVSIVPMSVPAPAPSNLNSFYLQKGTTTTTTTTRLNNGFFQLFRQPTSLPDDYTPTRSDQDRHRNDYNKTHSTMLVSIKPSTKFSNNF
jgi:hypothetical protein